MSVILCVSQCEDLCTILAGDEGANDAAGDPMGTATHIWICKSPCHACADLALNPCSKLSILILLYTYKLYRYIGSSLSGLKNIFIELLAQYNIMRGRVAQDPLVKVFYKKHCTITWL